MAGHDYHFGYKGEGNPSGSSRPCQALGIGCDIIPKVEQEGITVSSTYIRTLVARAKLSGPTSFWATPTPSATGCPTGRSWAPPWAFPP